MTIDSRFQLLKELQPILPSGDTRDVLVTEWAVRAKHLRLERGEILQRELINLHKLGLRARHASPPSFVKVKRTCAISCETAPTGSKCAQPV